MYRLEQIVARDSLTLARSTLAEWVGRVGVALQPLADRLTCNLLLGNTLHADDTSVAQLDPRRGKTRKAYLWAYRSNDLDSCPRIIVFDYHPGCSGAHARQFLGEWRGHLMVGDYGDLKHFLSVLITPPPVLSGPVLLMPDVNFLIYTMSIKARWRLKLYSVSESSIPLNLERSVGRGIIVQDIGFTVL